MEQELGVGWLLREHQLGGGIRVGQKQAPLEAPLTLESQTVGGGRVSAKAE